MHGLLEILLSCFPHLMRSRQAIACYSRPQTEAITKLILSTREKKNKQKPMWELCTIWIRLIEYFTLKKKLEHLTITLNLFFSKRMTECLANKESFTIYLQSGRKIRSFDIFDKAQNNKFLNIDIGLAQTFNLNRANGFHLCFL